MLDNFTPYIANPINNIDRGVVMPPKYLQVSIANLGKSIPKEMSITAIINATRGGVSMFLRVSMLIIGGGDFFPSMLMK